MDSVEKALSVLLLVAVFAALFAVRMSWEKYCIRTRRPFRSWLGKDR